jgi:hypothetical protein
LSWISWWRTASRRLMMGSSVRQGLVRNLNTPQPLTASTAVP